MKKIAIQGHPTRGKDVIKILKSLGGSNRWDFLGIRKDRYYFINDQKQIDYHSKEFMHNYHFLYTWYTLEEYEQKYTNMEKRNIQIDLTTAKEWYKQGGDLRKVALQAFTENELNAFPKSWEEYCKINPYLNTDKETIISVYGHPMTLSDKIYERKSYPGALSSKERAEQFIILNKLLQIRDYYNQGWKPNWGNDDEDKYCIVSRKNNLKAIPSWQTNYLFAFKTRELRDEFLQNFEKDLEFIKEFL
jgi:hypothetical protein